MIRWFIKRDGSKVLQLRRNFTDNWDDVPEVDEKQESILKAQEEEEKELENERNRKQLEGKRYMVRTDKGWIK